MIVFLFFLGIKLRYKTDFQDLFEKEFRETVQNLNSIKEFIEKMAITIVWISWMSWNFASSLKMPRYIQKVALAVLIFSEG